MSPSDPLLAQGVVFALSGLTGVALGLAVDGQRALRRVLAPSRWLGHALDAACVVLALPIAAAGWLAANWGAMRAYPVAGLLLGGALYLTLGSPVVLPAWTGALRLVWGAAAAALAAGSWIVRAPLAALARRRPPRAPGPTESG